MCFAADVMCRVHLTGHNIVYNQDDRQLCLMAAIGQHVCIHLHTLSTFSYEDQGKQE